MCVTHKHTHKYVLSMHVVKKLKLDKRVKNKTKTNPPIDNMSNSSFVYPSKSFNVQTCINEHILSEVSTFV